MLLLCELFQGRIRLWWKPLGFTLASAFFCLIHHLATNVDAGVNKAPVLLGQIRAGKVGELWGLPEISENKAVTVRWGSPSILNFANPYNSSERQCGYMHWAEQSCMAQVLGNKGILWPWAWKSVHWERTEYPLGCPHKPSMLEYLLLLALRLLSQFGGFGVASGTHLNACLCL